MTYQKETLEEEYQQLVRKLVDSRVKRLEPFIDKSSILLAYGEPSKRVVEKLDCDEKFVCHRDDSPIKCTGNFRRLDDLGELETSRADVLWYTGNVDLDTIKSELRELSSFLGPKSVLVAEVNVFSVVRSKDALLSIKDELARLGFHENAGCLAIFIPRPTNLCQNYLCLDILFQLSFEIVIIFKFKLKIITVIMLNSFSRPLITTLIFDRNNSLSVG